MSKATFLLLTLLLASPAAAAEPSLLEMSHAVGEAVFDQSSEARALYSSTAGPVVGALLDGYNGAVTVLNDGIVAAHDEKVKAYAAAWDAGDAAQDRANVLIMILVVSVVKTCQQYDAGGPCYNDGGHGWDTGECPDGRYACREEGYCAQCEQKGGENPNERAPWCTADCYYWSKPEDR